MKVLFFFLLFLVNFGISWANAYVVGKSWAESKVVGGWTRFMVWCTAIMSACGFTWCYLIVLSCITGAVGILSPQYIMLMMKIGYVVIILPIIGTGLAMWLDSVTTAYRERSLGSVGVAGWNTFAQIHNTYEAASTLPGFLKDIGEAFSDSDSDGKGWIAVGFCLLFAIGGGILTTMYIVKKSAKGYASNFVNSRNMQAA